MGESTAKILPRSIDSRAADGASYGVDTRRTRRGARVCEHGRALTARLRVPRHPRLWFEILLIALSYWIYSMIRNSVPEQRAAAMRNAREVWAFEHGIGLAVERSINHGANSVTWLIVGMNYYYATLHFIVTLGVLVWLFRAHPGRYAPTRLVLFVTTGVALVGYYCYPLAPPRLMGGGFIDTVKVHHTWGSMASGDLAHVSNQFAAMPSMHIGWSLWCGLTIATLAQRRWVKALGMVYPAVTLLVIVSTANHFWMDALGGVACLTVGFAVSYVVYGRLAYRLPQRVRVVAAA
jgi:hypothetical protein